MLKMDVKMKSKLTHSKSHGPSRLERLLERSIQHEIKIRSLRRELLALSAKIAIIEHCPVESDIP